MHLHPHALAERREPAYLRLDRGIDFSSRDDWLDLLSVTWRRGFWFLVWGAVVSVTAIPVLLGLAVAAVLAVLGLPILLAGVALKWGSLAVGYWAAFVVLGTAAFSVMIVLPVTLGCIVLMADAHASGRIR